uniref:hypothetical protein n=1 Tax=Eubacterium cellulosolvens TaxID=29322 RepID=UPI0004836781|nr:hypothetical protein [[Eubacterium] cellulosolvens]
MSKILKLFDALILAIFIAAGAALVIPQQFMGIDATVAEQETKGDVPVGTVVYSKKVSSSEITEGEKIFVQDGDRMNVYTVVAYDEKNETITVDGEENASFSLSDNYQRMVGMVPLIGYLMIATQSSGGLLLLGILLVFVIFIYIVSELIRSGDDGEEEDDDKDDNVYKELLEKKKKKEKEAAKAEREALRAKKSKKKAERGHDEEGEEDAENVVDALPSGEPDPAVDDMTEISAEIEEEDEPAALVEEESREGLTGEALPDVQAALEAALESQPLGRTGETAQFSAVLPEEDTEPQVNEDGEIELAIPVRTADELLEKAYAQGLDPVVEDDVITGIKLVDYSDCI